MASVYGAILDRVVTDIQSLDLSGIADASVVRKNVATLRENDMPGLPCVLVSPNGRVSVPRDEGTNMRDDVQYPVLVLFCKSGTQSNVSDDTYLEWQEIVRKKFINKSLNGVACVFDCFVEHRDTYNIDAWLKNLSVGGIVFRFKSRELRD